VSIEALTSRFNFLIVAYRRFISPVFYKLRSLQENTRFIFAHGVRARVLQ